MVLKRASRSNQHRCSVTRILQGSSHMQEKFWMPLFLINFALLGSGLGPLRYPSLRPSSYTHALRASKEDRISFIRDSFHEMEGPSVQF
jgi:hypothetical protein